MNAPETSSLEIAPIGTTAALLGPVSAVRLAIIAGVAAYILALLASYILVVAPGMGGFVAYPRRAVPAVYIVAAAGIALMPTIWLPLAVRRPSQIVYWCLYLFVYVPSCTIPMLALTTPYADALLLAMGLLVSFSVMGAGYVVPLLTIPSLRVPSYVFWIIIVAVFSLVSFRLVQIFGFDLDLPSWFEVYDVRAEYRSELRDHPFASVAIRWLLYIVDPILIGWGVLRRRPAIAALGALNLIFIYATTGFKVALMLPVLIGGLALLLRGHGTRFALRLVMATLALVVVTLAIDLVRGHGLFSYVLTRRVLLVPALLTGYYYEFFSQHGFMQLGHMGIGERLFGVSNPYTATQPYLIASRYFDNPEASANANLFADGFSNFGFFGMVLFSALMAGAFYLYDSIAASRDYWLSRILMAGPIITLANSALIAVLIGHGFLAATALAYLLPGAPGRPDAEREARLQQEDGWRGHIRGEAPV